MRRADPASGWPMAGGVHLGGLVACGSQSPEMPRGVRTCYLSCFRRRAGAEPQPLDVPIAYGSVPPVAVIASPTNQTVPGPAAVAATGSASIWPAGVSAAVEGTGMEVQVVPLKLSSVVTPASHTSVGDKAARAEPDTAAPVCVVAVTTLQVLPFH